MGSNGVKGAQMESNGGRAKETHGVEWCQWGTHEMKGRVKETHGIERLDGAHMGSKWG